MLLALCAATAPIAVMVTAPPPAAAHPCAEVTVWVSGNPTTFGGCHASGDPGDVCQAFGFTVGGTGPGIVACAFVPVRR